MSNLQSIFNNLEFNSVDRTASQDIIVQYITNPDGSIRWIWPSRSKNPLFLKFYHIQGLKANLFSLLIKFIFIIRLQKLVFKTGKIESIDPLLINNNDWALFTGTVGPNQKYIIYKNATLNDKGSFTKIALTPQSQNLINNERCAIEVLRKEKKINFHFPAILKGHKDSVTFQENPSFNVRANKWSKQHTLFLQNIESVNSNECSFPSFDKNNGIGSRIQSLKINRNNLPSGIIKKLEFLHQSLENTTVKTHMAHGDFTPWNSYTNAHGQLYIYDWELSSKNYPLGFDYFHFIIQDGVLKKQKSWAEIKKEIYTSNDSLFQHNEIELYLSYYLLINVLNYLEVYEKQEHWHIQIHWLIETWNLALSDCLSNVINSRELIVLDIFDQLHSVDYSGLKLSDQVEKVSEYSDIDILMSKQTGRQLIQFLRRHPLITKVHIQSSTAMTKMMVLTTDNLILSIDNIYQLKRKSLEYMSVSQLIKRPFIDRHGIKKMNLMDSLQFLGLFYGLNNATIPDKFKKYEQVLTSGNKNIDNIINKQFISGKPMQKELYTEINKSELNSGISALKNKILYGLDSIQNIFGQKGLIITFSGVDGAGKSTIIENTKKVIEKKMRKRVVVIRHRPSVLPILSAWTKGKSKAEKEAATNLPRQGQNKSVLSSLFRFGYYYTDYFFGQFYIYFKHVLRGDVVLYDRYYFDFINDSLRSNIRLPHWILNSGYRLLLKPDLNFFLYADAETILSRKKELNESTINNLTSEYLSLFKKLGRNKSEQYQSIENINLEHTLAHISTTIQRKII